MMNPCEDNQVQAGAMTMSWRSHCFCNKFLFSFVALFLGASLIFAAPAAATEVLDRIVAVVNGEMITLSELNKNLELVLASSNIGKGVESQDADVQELRRQVLNKMVNDILLEEEAERYKIEVSDKEVQDYIDRFMQQNKLNQQQLVSYLNEQGMSLEEYKKKIKGNIIRDRLITAMVRRKVVVTDEDIAAYYEIHKNDLASGSLPTVPGETSSGSQELSLIVFDSAKDAKAVRQNILNGEISFEQAARQYSVGPAADQGGDLGRVSIPDLVPEMQAVATKLPEGQVSEPFTLSGKTAIIRLTSGTNSQGASQATSQTSSLEQVRDQIKALLEEQKMEEVFSEYIQRLRDQAVIDIKL